MIPGVHHEVDLNCTLPGCYAVSCVIAQKNTVLEVLLNTNKQVNKLKKIR